MYIYEQKLGQNDTVHDKLTVSDPHATIVYMLWQIYLSAIEFNALSLVYSVRAL